MGSINEQDITGHDVPTQELPKVTSRRAELENLNMENRLIIERYGQELTDIIAAITGCADKVEDSRLARKLLQGGLETLQAIRSQGATSSMRLELDRLNRLIDGLPQTVATGEVTDRMQAAKSRIGAIMATLQ